MMSLDIFYEMSQEFKIEYAELMENRASILKRLILLKQRATNDCRDMLDTLIKKKLNEPDSASNAHISSESESDGQSPMNKRIKRALRNHVFGVA